MDTIERIGRIEQRIRELDAGKEIDAKHINVLLTVEQQQQFAAEWQRQQQLRKIKKPAVLNSYETVHKQAAALLARCNASSTRTKAERATLAKLQSKCAAAIERAHAEIAKQLKKRAALAEWLDRGVADVADIEAIELDSTNQNTVKNNNTILNDCYEQLPILVTSKNIHKRVSQEQRFGWQTKRDIRLQLLRETLAKLYDNLVAELEREQHQREVRAARVFMDAYVAAAKVGKNAWAEANAALQRNGFKRLDTQYSVGMNERDREVRAMEAALMKQIEAAMTDDEREQLAMSREYDKAAGWKG
jgi:hypothetical protein